MNIKSGHYFFLLSSITISIFFAPQQVPCRANGEFNVPADQGCRTSFIIPGDNQYNSPGAIRGLEQFLRWSIKALERSYGSVQVYSVSFCSNIQLFKSQVSRKNL